MEKCKCIKESKWFLLDDSFDENSKEGGEFSYQVGQEYEFYFKEHPICSAYIVKHGNKEVGFGEEEFRKNFEI